MTMPNFKAPETPAKQLEQRIARIIRNSDSNKPRSLQVNIGPSEVGEPCLRKLAYKLIQVEKVNTFSDPWPAISGTAIHAYLAEMFGETDEGDWLVEHRVTARPGLSGTVDLFDIKNGIVIDHKCVGATSMKARKLDGPTHQQLVQLHIYAYGLEQQHHEVKQVALAFYPLGGMLSGLHVWVGDYDRQIALDAMSRMDDLITLLTAVDVEENPENWAIIPAEPSRMCNYCPWHIPNSDDLTKGCAGQ